MAFATVELDWRKHVEFDADLIVLPRAVGSVDGFHLGTRSGHLDTASRLTDFYGDPRSNPTIVTRAIATAMQIETDCRGPLLEWLPVIVLTGDDQRNGALDACGPAVFDSGEWTRSVKKFEILHK